MTSKIKVDNIANQSDSNIVNKCGTTITLGASGDTISLASGASQTGFGRTGTVDWDTTAKTAGFTAVSGNGYFVDTSSGGLTVTLPASPSAGDIVAVKDYANTADTNNITIGRNSSNVDGTAADPIIANEGGSIILVYADATKGWLVVEAAQKSDISFPEFVAATGGTITCSGDYRIHTFTSPGTFTVSDAGNASGSNTIDYLVVAGGGGAGGDAGGGGGGGGVRFTNSTFTNSGPSSPRNGGTALPVTATGYPVTVGGGGAGVPAGNGTPSGTKGSDSIFAGTTTITSTGGGLGAGAVGTSPVGVGQPGGSGGGGRAGICAPNNGSGNTPPTSPSQGMDGGSTGGAPQRGGGGGGGFIVVGSTGNGPGPGFGGPGGSGGGFPAAAFGPANGQANTATGPVAPGTPDGFKYFAGGGHGGTTTGCLGPTPAGNGSLGGGGVVNAYPNPGGAGVTNTGGGGSAGSANDAGGGAGGSGIVVIRYKFQ